MMPTIAKILYATDLSPNAKYAFGYAAGMAHQFGAKITILHVLEQISPTIDIQLTSIMGQERWQELQTRNQREAETTIRQRLTDFCGEMQETLQDCPFIVSDIVVDQGVPADRILRQADRTHCDLLVMGTHGQGLLADAMLGSTARRVVRRCPQPVMVIRLPEA